MDIGGRKMRSCYTPGHASHHIAWLEDEEEVAYTGDVAGMRIEGANYIIPVAPPPDIDLVLWEGSLRKLEEDAPKKLFLTHFGIVHDVKWHLGEMRKRLRDWANTVQDSLKDDSESDVMRANAFHATEMKHMQTFVDASFREPYNYMGQPRESWHGLARYWRKKDG